MTRLRCAILDDYQNVALKLADWPRIAERVDVTVFDRPFTDAAEAIAALQDFEIVCAMRERTPFRADTLNALPRLKLLLTSGMRNAAIDLAAATARGVTVCGTAAMGGPTASLAIGLMLELTRHIGFESERMKAGERWQITLGEDIEGKTLGIIGLGKLGRKVAHIARAMGMNVIAWSQNLTPEACVEAGVTYAGKDELMASADIVSIHVILSKRTRGLISRDDLARMRPTAYIVNTARAPIVDEAALLDALQRRAIAGAALDVFSEEPLPRDHPLRRLDNVVLTPHLGYVTAENYRCYYREMVEDIEAWLKGAPVRVMG
ncbi:MAG: D-2-hydroxyacid dehydrogenase family protein [Xanthobacteraceae bacterium]|nr:D-2-hydroxyacid dehydrogenase family protein [Xanthobacteraceae bacterium]